MEERGFLEPPLEGMEIGCDKPGCAIIGGASNGERLATYLLDAPSTNSLLLPNPLSP